MSEDYKTGLFSVTLQGLYPLDRKPHSYPQIKIIDTFLCRQHKILFKDLHIKRVVDSFRYFECPLDLETLQKLYDEFENDIEVVPDGDLKIRVEFSLSPNFEFKTDVVTMDQLDVPFELVPAKVGEQKAGLGIGNFKTTARVYWDQNQNLIKKSNGQDVLGINEYGKVTETSRFNLFFQTGDQMFTPTLQSGCLDGVFRRHCLNQGYVEFENKKYPLREKDFTLTEIKGLTVWVGNSVRGLLHANLFV